MKNIKDTYTVVILPDPASKPYRFFISKTAAKILTGVASVISLVILGLLVHYVFLTRAMVEYKDLRKEAAIQERQIQSFAIEIVDLKKQMVRLKEMDAKLRVITDFNPPTQTAMTIGMGGAETTGLSEMEIGIPPEELVLKMAEEVKILRAEASRQELSFAELAQDMTDRRSVWEATPSIWPVRGWLSSGFGKRMSPFTGRLSMHNGIDIATYQNTPIVSPADGVVSHIGYHNRLGRLIKINHGYGVQTMYGHLAKSGVRIGQKVKRGDVIAYVGNTGSSTGPHLHYEIFINGLPVNPIPYIVN